MQINQHRIRARMKPGLVELYKALMPLDILTERFLISIEGKEVVLIFIGPDAFEENNYNTWLPNELWLEI